MGIFGSGMIMLGIALGLYRLQTGRPSRRGLLIGLAATLTAVLLSSSANGWPQFAGTVTLAPALSLVIANTPALRRGL